MVTTPIEPADQQINLTSQLSHHKSGTDTLAGTHTPTILLAISATIIAAP